MAMSLDDARASLCPSGTLRAGLNLANTLLTTRRSDGTPGGIAAELAQEVARRLDVPVQLVSFESPGALADALSSASVDIGFLGAEPARARTIDFTAPYVEIEATYLVPAQSTLQSVEEVDHEGIRIAVSVKSAYELYLARTLRHAQLVSVEGGDAAYERFVSERLDALAGLRPRLVTDSHKLPGSRVLPGRFTAIQQALGTPKGRGPACSFLDDVVAEVKSSGWVADAIARNAIRGLSIPR